MGGSLGRLVSSQSYNMSDQESSSGGVSKNQSSNSKDEKDKENSVPSENPSCGSSSEREDTQNHVRENSCSSSESGSSKLSSTLCLSWRTRSENWSKSKRRALAKSSTGCSNNVVTKKEFFGTKKSKKWSGTSKKKQGNSSETSASGSSSCVCTMYRKTNNDASVPIPSTSNANTNQNPNARIRIPVSANPHPIIDLSKFNPADYPIDDEEEILRRQRAKEMAEGVDLIVHSFMDSLALQEEKAASAYPPHGAHSQVDYVHYLVPDLKQITNCSFYWGKIDRYEAERLLDKKPEGTFLLRDSAQEEYLFSVSFRRYGRSLHARIEQWNSQFSFDSHDPSVFSSPTVTGLIEHYKDPTCCMFFEPMLTTPLHRNFTFDLQHLARATVCSLVTYDGINQLDLPKSLKMCCKEYHYKQRVRIRRLE